MSLSNFRDVELNNLIGIVIHIPFFYLIKYNEDSISVVEHSHSHGKD
jgi:hypothetical protein